MRTLLKLLLNNTALLLLLFLVSAPLRAQDGMTFDRSEPPTMEMLVEAGEVFEYEVSYGFFTLGWVDVELLPDTTYNGEPVHHMRTRIRSNRRVPFVGTRIVNYENLFGYTDEWLYSYEFWRDDIHEDEYDRVRIVFDREEEEVRFFERGEPADTLDLEDPASGGDIIFYFSRLFAGSDEGYELPVYIEGEKGWVTASNSSETEMRSYDAFDDEIETYKSEGEADIEGPFGFRGRFRAWFATDDLRVPVEAHVRVIFGNVKLRLINYEKHELNSGLLQGAGARR